MKEILNFYKLSFRGIPVGFIGELCDLLLLYLLGVYTKLDIVYQIYISQIIGILITFLGNYIYTFNQNRTKGIISKFYKYVITNILFNIICSEITIEIIKYLNNSDSSYLLDYLDSLGFYINNKVTPLGNTIVKIIVDCSFYLVKMYVFQFIFKKKI